MKRREFGKRALVAGLGAPMVSGLGASAARPGGGEIFYTEPSRQLPVQFFDVVVVGGGTSGVVAALAAARRGAKTMLIEAKGYTGGTVTEGGTALHSYYNLWKAFPGVEQKQVVKGMPQEIIDRLAGVGGTSGHGEMDRGYTYDSVCTSVDTELYKLVTMGLLDEAGVFLGLNTLAVGAVRDGATLRGVITESRSGREAIYAKTFIDGSAYGDLCAHAGASFSEPNDYPVCNSFGLGNVDVDRLNTWLEEHDALSQRAHGMRSGRPDQIIRIQGRTQQLPEAFHRVARDIGLSMVTTTVHDNYFMFIKINLKMPVSPTSRDAVARADLELRRRQARAVQLFRDHVPGCEKAFMARTSPTLNIRRGRLITCDYDMTHEDVIEGRHFDDEVLTYGFHDSAPRLQIKGGGTYGLPYRALRVHGLDNLLAVGMMITRDHRAHMSTRNTVCCMAQGQAAGTAAALCAARDLGTRRLPYDDLRRALEEDGVHFEPS